MPAPAQALAQSCSAAHLSNMYSKPGPCRSMGKEQGCKRAQGFSRGSPSIAQIGQHSAEGRQTNHRGNGPHRQACHCSGVTELLTLSWLIMSSRTRIRSAEVMIPGVPLSSPGGYAAGLTTNESEIHGLQRHATLTSMPRWDAQTDEHARQTQGKTQAGEPDQIV